MREINPQETTRAYAFKMWMQVPKPMVTFFKVLERYARDISRKLIAELFAVIARKIAVVHFFA